MYCPSYDYHRDFRLKLFCSSLWYNDPEIGCGRRVLETISLSPTLPLFGLCLQRPQRASKQGRSLNTAASTLDIGQLPQIVGRSVFLIGSFIGLLIERRASFVGQVVLHSS